MQVKFGPWFTIKGIVMAKLLIKGVGGLKTAIWQLS